MKRQRKRRLWLVVAAFALRAAVPAGYMPAALAEGLPFVPCPEAAPGWAALAKGSPHHHTAADHSPGGENSAGWDVCPFAVVSGAMAPARTCDPPVAPPWRDPPPPAAATLLHPPAPASACQPRAPPVDPRLYA